MLSVKIDIGSEDIMFKFLFLQEKRNLNCTVGLHSNQGENE